MVAKAAVAGPAIASRTFGPRLYFLCPEIDGLALYCVRVHLLMNSTDSEVLYADMKYAFPATTSLANSGEISVVCEKLE